MKNTETGFTLLEIMLSIALLSTIVMLTINILSNELRLQNTINDRYPFDKIMNRITNDLSGAYLLPQNPEDKKFNFIHSIQNANSNLIFSVINNPSLIYNTKESSIAQIGYIVETKDNKNQLIRIVDTKMDSGKDVPASGVGVRSVLAEDIKKFEVKFWKKKEFVDNWNSTDNELGRLPKMVKVILTLYIPQKNNRAPKQELKLETITYLKNSVIKQSSEEIQTEQNLEQQSGAQQSTQKQTSQSQQEKKPSFKRPEQESAPIFSQEYEWQ